MPLVGLGTVRGDVPGRGPGAENLPSIRPAVAAGRPPWILLNSLQNGWLRKPAFGLASFQARRASRCSGLCLQETTCGPRSARPLRFQVGTSMLLFIVRAALQLTAPTGRLHYAERTRAGLPSQSRLRGYLGWHQAARI